MQITRWREILARNLEEKTGEAVRTEVMEVSGLIDDKAAGTKKAAWVKRILDELDARLGEDERTAIMEECGRHCIGRTVIERARAVKRHAKSLDDLVEGLNQHHLCGGRLILEGNVIHGYYERCYCGLVSKARERISPTFCQCSRGWVREFFEGVFGNTVEVEMLETIQRGDSHCHFLVHLPDRNRCRKE